MLRFAILITILLSLVDYAFAQGDAPPFVKGQGASSKSVGSVILVPNKLATKTSSSQTKLEMGNFNLLENPSFDHMTVGTGWTVTATGTATCTLTGDTSNKMEGEAKHGLLTMTGGASGGTCSIKQSVNVTTGQNTMIGAMFRADPLGGAPSLTTVVYTLVGGTRTTSRDITNLGTSLIWEPFYVNEVSSQSTAGVEALVTIPASSLTYLAVDRAEVSQGRNTSTASVITPWQSYTPTFTGFGTVSTQSFYWRQVGGSIEIEGRFVSGVTTPVEARVSLPNSYTSSSQISTLQIAGTLGVALVSSAYFGSYVTIEPSVSYLTFSYQSSTANNLTKRLANDYVNAQPYSIKASIPIANLAGSTQVFASQCGAGCENVLSAYVTDGAVTTTVSDEVPSSWINGNCTNAAAGVYVCTFDSGIFTTAPKCWVQSAVSAARLSNVSATSATSVSINTQTDAGVNADTNFNLFCQKSPTDYQSSRTIVGSFKEVTTIPGINKSIRFGFQSTASCTTGNCAGTFWGSTLSAGNVVFSSTGTYNITIPSGKCSAAPNCSGAIMPMVSNSNKCNVYGQTSTTAQAVCTNTAGAVVNEGIQFNCTCEAP